MVRTRALAAELAREGHVRVNGTRATAASRAVRPGDVLTVALPGRARVLRVLALPPRRGGAPEAAGHYAELGEGTKGGTPRTPGAE